MANKSDITRNAWMLKGPLSRQGYDWWWHSFTGYNEKTGAKKTFFVEFFTCNPALAKDEPVIVWNDINKRKEGVKPSYLMVNAGYWGKDHAQLHRFFPWSQVKVDLSVPYMITAADCICSEKFTKGSINVSYNDMVCHPEWMCDYGSIEWDLEIDKKIAFNVGYGASKFFREINAFEMFWHAEGMKTKYKGYITINGDKYIVSPDTSNGYADKNWGKDFTSPWVWLSSNDLTSRKTGKKLENSVFNIGGGRPKIYNIAIDKKLLGEFYYEGRDYEFNFSKFWTLSTTKFKCIETEKEICWYVIQTTYNSKLVTKVKCKKEDMLNINYEAPNGLKLHNRLWNGGTGIGILKLYKKNLFGRYELIDEVYAKGIGCEYGEYGESRIL